MRILLSLDPDRTLFPSGEKQTDFTHFKWPVTGLQTTWPLLASHTIIVLSSDPETIRDPSREYATESTQCEWPVKVEIN